MEFMWSEWRDLNPRPPHPQRGALPGCATLRYLALILLCSDSKVKGHLAIFIRINFMRECMRQFTGCVAKKTPPGH